MLFGVQREGSRTVPETGEDRDVYIEKRSLLLKCVYVFHEFVSRLRVHASRTVICEYSSADSVGCCNRNYQNLFTLKLCLHANLCFIFLLISDFFF